MSVRNGQLAIASHANVAVTNGRFTPLIVEMPNKPVLAADIKTSVISQTTQTDAALLRGFTFPSAAVTAGKIRALLVR